MLSDFAKRAPIRPLTLHPGMVGLGWVGGGVLDGPWDGISQRKIGNPKRYGSSSARENDYLLRSRKRNHVPRCKMKSCPGPCPWRQRKTTIPSVHLNWS